MDGIDVVAAANECHDVLAPVVDHDWAVAIPGLDWTVADALAHAAQCCLYYAMDFAGGETEIHAIESRVDPAGEPAEILRVIVSGATVLARTLDAAPTGARGFHPFGIADASGFAAMACDELLIHTDDAARGLGVGYAPDPGLCARTLHRLFPWAPADLDPWDGLRWANHRLELPGRPAIEHWWWHCAPLEEWNGRPGYTIRTGS
jgi:uncharacterized protein (TIGR03083 family)